MKKPEKKQPIEITSQSIHPHPHRTCARKDRSSLRWPRPSPALDFLFLMFPGVMHIFKPMTIWNCDHDIVNVCVYIYIYTYIYIYMCVWDLYTSLKCSYSQTCRIIYNNYLHIYIYIYKYTAIEEDFRDPKRHNLRDTFSILNYFSLYGKYARSMNIDLHMLYGKNWQPSNQLLQ